MMMVNQQPNHLETDVTIWANLSPWRIYKRKYLSSLWYFAILAPCMVLLPILPIQVASVWSTSDLLGSMYIYIYISFASWNEVITQFLDPLCGNLSQHIISRSEIKIGQENLFHWNTQTKKNINISLNSLASMSRSFSSQAIRNALVHFFFSFKADLRHSVLS